MMRIAFTLLMAAFCWAQADEKPSAIVLFYADDLGCNDTSAYGCEKAPCPNLDRLAEEGLLFTDAHSTASVCTPSRFSLMTGQYAWRQQGTGILPGDAKLILPTCDKRMTLPSMLRQAGYRTAAIGKWHLGLGAGGEPIDWNRRIAPGPREVGFDYSFIMAATADRVPCVYIRQGEMVGLDPADPIRVSYKKAFPGEQTGSGSPGLVKPWARSDGPQHNGTIVDGIPRIGHMTGGAAALWKDQDLADRLTEEALAFIRESAGRPIFLYFATNDIHVPRDPHQRFRGKSSLGLRGDAVVQLDDCLGRIRSALKEHGYDDCLFIFASDNGPVLSDGYKDGADRDCAGHNPAAPYSGGKYRLEEGGTRTPFIVCWPGHVPQGKRTAALVSQVDLARSLASLVGVEAPAGSMPDSRDVLPALLGRDAVGRDELVEQAHGGLLALRSGPFKYIPGPKPRLHDLSRDREEKVNLADKMPAKARELGRRLESIRAGQP